MRGLWRWGLALMIGAGGCQPMLPLAHAPGFFRLSLSEGFHTQAALSDVNHLVLKLYEVTGAPVLVETVTLQAPLNASVSAAFAAVPDGLYQVTADAFASSDDSVSITAAGAVTSANTATVSGGAVSYSSGSAFALALPLKDGGLASIDVTVSGPAGTAFPVQLVKSGIFQAHYTATTSDPSFVQVYAGDYAVWGAVRTGAGTATVSRKSSNSAAVSGLAVSYSSGTSLVSSVAGLIRSLSLYDPPVLGANSMINAANDVTADGAGNLYIADTTNHRVRKVDTLGQITTVAGNGTAGFLGDNGPATSARLNNPRGVAVDASGNLYIADSSNNRIRKVATTGTITTFAGNGTAGYSGDNGVATSAAINAPYDVAVDGSGNLYIADTSNNRIRKVASGTITTCAGSGTAGFLGDGGLATAARVNLPRGVAVDEFGVLYIADTTNHRLRKVATNGTITTVAGTGTGTYNGDGIVATAAALNAPGGVAVDEFGVLYIADTTNHRVRKIQGGLISTVAGNGTSGYLGDNTLAASTRINAPGGVAVSGTSLLVADTGNHRVRKVDSASVITTSAGTGVAGYSGDTGAALSVPLNIPLGLAGNSSGDVWVADNANHRIRQIAANGVVTTVAGNGTAGYSGDGGLAIAAQLNSPRGVARDAAGNLYVADTANHRIRKIAVSGTITTVAGTGVAGYGGDGGSALLAQLNGPYGVALDSSGNLYVADRGNHVVRKVDTGGVIATVAGTGVSGFSGDGGPAPSARLNLPRGVAVDALGVLYIADTGSHCIRRVDALGQISTLAGTGGTSGFSGDGGVASSALLNGPVGVAVDGGGNVYVTDQNNHRIRKIDPSGTIFTVAGTGTAGYTGDNGSASLAKLNNPYGLFVDPSGILYVADASNNAIRKLD